jgi:hypothetical protein
VHIVFHPDVALHTKSRENELTRAWAIVRSGWRHQAVASRLQPYSDRPPAAVPSPCAPITIDVLVPADAHTSPSSTPSAAAAPRMVMKHSIRSGRTSMSLQSSSEHRRLAILWYKQQADRARLERIGVSLLQPNKAQNINASDTSSQPRQWQRCRTD